MASPLDPTLAISQHAHTVKDLLEVVMRRDERALTLLTSGLELLRSRTLCS
jgi:hypothetical protein